MKYNLKDKFVKINDLKNQIYTIICITEFDDAICVLGDEEVKDIINYKNNYDNVDILYILKHKDQEEGMTEDYLDNYCKLVLEPNDAFKEIL